jgi:hypothetical protein
MASAFEPRTLSLTFDLLFDQVPATIGKAAGIVWSDVLTSKKFHSQITERVRSAFVKEYGLIGKDFYLDNKKEIHSFISKTAGKYAENSDGGKKIKDLGSELEGSLKEIENHFNHSKAGIWIDEASKSVTVIVSVLVMGSYGIYSFRNTKLMQNVINKASLIGLTSKSFHVGGIKVDGAISDYSASKSTVKLNVSTASQWKSIQLTTKSNGVVNFNTGQIMDASTSVDVSYQINEEYQLSGGISSRKGRDKTKNSENTAYFKAHITSGAHSILLRCSVTDKSNSPINKECSASASIKF